MSNHAAQGMDYNAITGTYTSHCTCDWASAPTDFRPQAAFDLTVHHLDATEPAIA